MATEQATNTAHAPVDILTINGLLNILGENINSIYADSSDANIKKSNAILQNVNAIKGIYTLAFDKTRLDLLKDNRRITHRLSFDFDDTRDYATNRELLGDVLGDSKNREQSELQKALDSKYREVISGLYTEIDEIKESGDEKTTKSFYDFGDNELEILNACLDKSKTKLETTLEQDEYLIKTLTQDDFKELVKRQMR